MDVNIITALISVASVAVGSLITLLSQYIVEKMKYGYEIKDKRKSLAINIYKLSIKFLQTLAKIECESVNSDADELDSLYSHRDTLKNKIEEDIFIALSIKDRDKLFKVIKEYEASGDKDIEKAEKEVSEIFKKYF